MNRQSKENSQFRNPGKPLECETDTKEWNATWESYRAIEKVDTRVPADQADYALVIGALRLAVSLEKV